MTARRILVGLTFMINILLGNFCLLSIGYAATPAGDSGIEPVSHEIYECPWIAMNKESSAVHPSESPCASGHCIGKPKPQTSCTVTAVQTVVMPALPAGMVTDLRLPATHDAPPPSPTESPPDPLRIRTIVLRR